MARSCVVNRRWRLLLSLSAVRAHARFLRRQLFLCVEAERARTATVGAGCGAFADSSSYDGDGGQAWAGQLQTFGEMAHSEGAVHYFALWACTERGGGGGGLKSVLFTLVRNTNYSIYG